jgi:uncharacterized membrane protein
MFARLLVPVGFLFVIVIAMAGCHDDELPTGPNNIDTVDDPVDTTDTTGDDPVVGKFCFQASVLPILINNCATSGCHDNETREEEISMMSYADVMNSRPGDLVRPGQPWESEMYKVLFKSGEDMMPPSDRRRLTADEMDKIRRWILGGAKDDDCGPKPTCDTVGVTFVADIKPIIDLRCNSCHSPTTKQGGIDLSTQALVESVGRSGKLLGSISRTAPYKPMPPSAAAKASDCDVAKVRAWINGGYR